MNRSRSLILLSLALTLGLGACAKSYEGPSPGVRVEDPNAPNARLNLDRVVILDKELQDARAGKLAIESQGARRTGTGTIEVFAVIRNRTDFPQQIEARTSFFDGQGVPLEGPSAWQRIHLQPNSITNYKELSSRTDVAHYYVEIREGR